MVVWIVFEGDYGSDSERIVEVCASEALAQRVLASRCVESSNGWDYGKDGVLSIDSYLVKEAL